MLTLRAAGVAALDIVDEGLLKERELVPLAPDEKVGKLSRDRIMIFGEPEDQRLAILLQSGFFY